MRRRSIVMGAFLLACASSFAETVARLSSPNGLVVVEASLDSEGTPTYSVRFRGRPIVVDSGLGLTLRDVGPLDKGFHVVGTRPASRDERYVLVSGKTREGRDRCEEVALELER